MRRAPIVITATAAGVAGVLAFHTPTRISALPTGSGTTGSGNQKASSSNASSNTQAGTPSNSSASQSTPPSNSSPSTPSASTTTANRSMVGTAEQYGYGVLSVRVTVSGSRITDVSLANLQVAEPYSQQIASQVVPMLRSEVLSAQSAQINGISGATYTCEAYALSLQSALNKLHVK